MHGVSENDAPPLEFFDHTADHVTLANEHSAFFLLHKIVTEKGNARVGNKASKNLCQYEYNALESN